MLCNVVLYSYVMENLHNAKSICKFSTVKILLKDRIVPIGAVLNGGA